jgi:hypothetical protein
MNTSVTKVYDGRQVSPQDVIHRYFWWLQTDSSLSPRRAYWYLTDARQTRLRHGNMPITQYSAKKKNLHEIAP